MGQTGKYAVVSHRLVLTYTQMDAGWFIHLWIRTSKVRTSHVLSMRPLTRSQHTTDYMLSNKGSPEPFILVEGTRYLSIIIAQAITAYRQTVNWGW